MPKNLGDEDVISFTKEELKQLYVTGAIIILIFSVFELIMSISQGLDYTIFKYIIIRFPFRAVMAMGLLIFFRTLKIFLKK